MKHARSYSIDSLRGLVMVLMALDHTRDFFTATGTNPTNLAQVDVWVFVTRWITHICAPVFVFLTGTGAYLSLSSGRPKNEVATFLCKRALWILFLELTIVRFGWIFDLSYAETQLQVFWAIGWSLFYLAAMLYLPLYLNFAISLSIVLFHNALDGVQAVHLGKFSALWKVIHEPGFLFPSQSVTLEVLYPVLPWFGVMGLGFFFGSLWQKSVRKNKLAYAVGLGSLTLFILIRALNFYGDTSPWVAHDNFLYTLLSFVNLQKYPPSLLYLLLMLGMAITLLGVFESFPKIQLPFFNTFGRVPLFYYLLHVFLIHGLAILAAKIYQIPLSTLDIANHPPEGYGYPLPMVYLIWVGVVATLYPFCRWFAGVKKRYAHPLLRYL